MRRILPILLCLFFLSNPAYAFEEYIQLAPQGGLNADLPKNVLDDNSISNCENVWTRNGTIDRATLRLKEFSTVLPDEPNGIDYFEETDGTTWLMVMTSHDVAYRDDGNDKYVYLTPQYAVGTASFTKDSTTVEGAGGCLWQTNLGAGDYIKTGSDSADSGDTWYEVASITDQDTLEITVAYVAANSGAAAYKARTVFAGAITDLWDFATVYKEDKWVCTNGVDSPVSWNGSDATVTTVAGASTAKHCIYYEGYMMWGNLTNYPQRIEWAEQNDFDDYTNGDTGTADIEGADEVTGFGKWQDFLVVFKKQSIHIMWLVETDLIFNRDCRVRGIGCYAGKSIISFLNKIYFWSSDSKFRAFNGLHANEVISTNIDTITSAIPANYEDDIYGGYIEELNHLWWAVPSGPASTYNDLILTYNLDTRGWSKLDIEAVCFGTYLTEAAMTWDTIPYSTWGEWAGRWDDRTFTTNAPLDLMGNRDKYIYRMHSSEQDNLIDFTGFFETNQTAFGHLNKRKRLLRYRTYWKREAAGEISLQIRVDNKGILETVVTRNLDDQDDRDIQVIEIICDYSGKTFGLYASGSNAFSYIGCIFEYEQVSDR